MVTRQDPLPATVASGSRQATSVLDEIRGDDPLIEEEDVQITGLDRHADPVVVELAERLDPA
jgi:hypothetical protein